MNALIATKSKKLPDVLKDVWMSQKPKTVTFMSLSLFTVGVIGAARGGMNIGGWSMTDTMTPILNAHLRPMEAR
jgi:hypothetical protein